MFGASRERDRWVGIPPKGGPKSLRIHVEDRALDRHDRDRIRELHAFLANRDYFVTRTRDGLKVAPYNPLTVRGDRERLARALEQWQKLHPVTHVEIVDEPATR